jgi:MOSC domain-containing protein YiiM
MISIQVVSINIGKPKKYIYEGKQVLTGINKIPIGEEKIYLSKTNLTGDGQGDLIHHGGPDKALCVYSYNHYPYWEEQLSRKLDYGSFGENITVKGMEEDKVCIGDLFSFGEAIVQVSQPRKPCHKLAKKHGLNQLPQAVIETGYTGFYLRVIQEGEVSVMDSLELLEKHPEGLTISFVNNMVYNPSKDRDILRKIVSVEELSEGWKSSFKKMLKDIDK